jgi:hypothetical protein
VQRHSSLFVASTFRHSFAVLHRLAEDLHQLLAVVHRVVPQLQAFGFDAVRPSVPLGHVVTSSQVPVTGTTPAADGTQIWPAVHLSFVLHLHSPAL